jgi:PAS domain S-box-containing protein
MASIDFVHQGFPNDGFLAGGGELGALMRETDWSQSPLGPAALWPQALKTAVRIMLTSRQPMFVWWGDQLINLYNDAYKSILGGKHPQAFAQPASVVWREIWDQIEPRVRSCMLGNEGTYDEALLLIMERNGYPEETYYTFSYSPVPNDEGGTGGILCANTDDTQRILGERQLALLRDLAARTADARSVEDACALSARSLETNSRDLPFALIYLVHDGRRTVTLAGACGIEPGSDAAPLSAVVDSAVWPFAEILRTNTPLLIGDVSARLSRLPWGAWNRQASQVVALPVAASGQTGQAGILIAGLNPFRSFDDGYAGFLALVAGQIGAAIGNAQAYESERKRAEALAEIDRAKTTFFSNVSHELRTPLTLLLGPVEDALGKPEGARQVAGEELRLVHRNGQRLLKLVNTLLDFSRLEAGRIDASFQPVDLAALTAELASVFRSAFEKAGVRLEISGSPLPAPVYVDREMWEKIVFNLLSNAFKFTLEGSVTVSVGEEDGWAILTVADTGIGIPLEELPHVFERFHRVAAAGGRTHEGTGIGLALVHELVLLHGGEISVASHTGKGSTFTVRIPIGRDHLPADRIGSARSLPSSSTGALPYIEEALRSLPDPGEPPPGITDLTFSGKGRQARAGDRRRILLADDNRDLRDYLKRLLAEEYDVETSPNGLAALDAVRKRAPDLVLSDVMMPELDGFGLLHALRADLKTRTIPVILLSARAGEEARVEGLEAGADDYLIKPFSARELLARVAAHIELARVRREAEEALRASDARFRRLFEANVFGLMLADFDGRILEANDAYLNLIGYSRADLEGGRINCARLTSAEDRIIDERAQAELRERGVCTPYEKEYVRHDGRRVPILIGAVLPAEPYHKQTTAICFCLDLSERKRMDEQLRQTQKLESLGVLAGGVAHDFNNLLVGILGNASLALEDLPPTNPTRPMLEEVVQAAERAADLTRQMLAYAGKGRFVVERIDLSQRVREIVVLIQAAIAKNVRLHIEAQEHLPLVEGDPAQIQQLIMNLIINGSEAMGDQNGVVAVSTGVEQVGEHAVHSVYSGHELAAGKYVFLEVRDSGCGMDEATQARIFDPFFTTKFTGRGLGLAAALGIVRGHKGAMIVRSAPGKGSTFRVLFPAMEGTGPKGEQPLRGRDLTGSGLVLVVDDEDTVRRTVKTTLHRYGYSVVTAENGRDALELFQEVCDKVAVVVLDMTMPVMSGEEALDRMKAVCPGVKVILSSGFSEAEALRRFRGKGLAGFIQKPYSAVQLAQKIKDALEEGR